MNRFPSLAASWRLLEGLSGGFQIYTITKSPGSPQEALRENLASAYFRAYPIFLFNGVMDSQSTSQRIQFFQRKIDGLHCLLHSRVFPSSIYLSKKGYRMEGTLDFDSYDLGGSF